MRCRPKPVASAASRRRPGRDGEHGVAPARPHLFEGPDHTGVVKVKSAVFQEDSGSLAFVFQPPGQCPGRGEGVDEAARRVNLEHLARLLAVARHVERESVSHHRGDLPLGPPQFHQLGFGQHPPHLRRWRRHELVHPDRREPGRVRHSSSSATSASRRSRVRQNFSNGCSHSPSSASGSAVRW